MAKRARRLLREGKLTNRMARAAGVSNLMEGVTTPQEAMTLHAIGEHNRKRAADPSDPFTLPGDPLARKRAREARNAQARESAWKTAAGKLRA